MILFNTKDFQGFLEIYLESLKLSSICQPYLENATKVCVSFDGSVGVKVNVAEQLHPDNGVDEKKHHHQHHDVWQGL